MKESEVTVTVLPAEEELTVAKESNLLQILHERDYPILSSCGGEGVCGSCRVKITENTPPPTHSERVLIPKDELDRDIRLACQTTIETDLTVELLRTSSLGKFKAALDSRTSGITPDSGIEGKDIQLSPPSKADQRADTERIEDEFEKEVRFSLSTLRKISTALRENDFRVNVIVEDRINLLDVRDRKDSSDPCGIAFDIGTTTIAGYLVNLASGEQIDVMSKGNPQQNLGSDVISRIKYARKNDEGLDKLQHSVLSAMNEIIRGLTERNSVDSDDIYKSTVVGNPTMIHLFAGIDPTNIDHAPFIPVLKNLHVLEGSDLDLNINESGRISLLPALSGYVGSDILSGILYTEMHKSSQLQLLIDIGTNGEIVLGSENEMLACSTAAGPAFEGANISYGMPAGEGAIAHVTVDGGEVDLEVLGREGVPKGLCGSGIVDAVGELLTAQIIASNGNLKPDNSSPLTSRVINRDGKLAFLLADSENPIFLNQRDIREIQLAKGALRAGIEVLLEEMGATIEDVGQIFLAEAFGNYLSKPNVLRLGAIPHVKTDKIVSVGNSAGEGAKMTLINRHFEEEIRNISRNITHVELSYHSKFSDYFTSSLRFPSTEA